MILHSVSKHTGVLVVPDTALALAKWPNIIITKKCVAGHLGALQDGPLSVLSGDDSALFGCLAHGGTGGILTGAHLRPELFVALVAHHRAGRIDKAKRLADTLAPLAALPLAEPNPAPAKASLSARGRIDPDACVPILPVSESLHCRLPAAIRVLEDVEVDCRLRLT